MTKKFEYKIFHESEIYEIIESIQGSPEKPPAKLDVPQEIYVHYAIATLGDHGYELINTQYIPEKEKSKRRTGLYYYFKKEIK